MPPDDTWEESQMHVIEELKRLNKCYNQLAADIGNIREDIAGLKVKSGLWGLLGGLIPVVLALGIWIIANG